MTLRASTACLLLAASIAAPAWAAVDVDAITSADLGPGPARVIVKFRGADAVAADVARLAERTGVQLRQQRRITPRMRVLELDVVNAPGAVGAAIERLREDSRVQYAELDRHRKAHAVANDPGFAPGNSNGQWYLRQDVSTPSATDATGAWDLTTGSRGVIVAVLDTGVRYEHPDLGTAGSGGRLLPGFDFVSDRSVANDGDGWDLDASDPGDWVTKSDISSLPFSDCTESDSSWHGTRVAGIIGAQTNNSTGVAGLLWQGWILPVRALGKCGGYDSDITAAMLWAGGVAVDGAPANPYPARVVNLSLGGGGTCPQGYRDAIAALQARGVLVVASAGNAGGVVDVPANCPGVAGVAGLRHAGTRVGYSNLGPEVALSAPAGNCVNTGVGEPCLYSIDTTTNLGTQGPTTSGYTDQFRFNVGTSFSAPVVSGIAGLMLSVNPRLSSSQLISRLQEGSTEPFPTPEIVKVDGDTRPGPDYYCRIPTSADDIQEFECWCTSTTCGAGMANALGAVQAALRPVAAVAVPSSVAAGQNVVLSGTASGAACSRTVAAYAWTLVASSGGATTTISGADTATATVIAPAGGSYTVRLTVTDDVGRQDTADVQVTPTSATTASAPFNPGASCSASVVAVSVSPVTASTRASGSTLAFTASVANAESSAVTWYVDDVAGGNATVGTISSTGLYTPPTARPSGGKVTVKAVPAADGARFASASVTILPPLSSGGGNGGGGGGGGSTDLLLCALACVAGLAGARRHRASR